MDDPLFPPELVAATTRLAYVYRCRHRLPQDANLSFHRMGDTLFVWAEDFPSVPEESVQWRRTTAPPTP